MNALQLLLVTPLPDHWLVGGLIVLFTLGALVDVIRTTWLQIERALDSIDECEGGAP